MIHVVFGRLIMNKNQDRWYSQKSHLWQKYLRLTWIKLGILKNVQINSYTMVIKTLIICDVSHFLYPVKTTNRSCRDCQQAIVSYHTNKLRNDGIDGFITKNITM